MPPHSASAGNTGLAHPKGYRPTTITYSSTPHDQMSTFCSREQGLQVSAERINTPLRCLNRFSPTSLASTNATRCA